MPLQFAELTTYYAKLNQYKNTFNKSNLEKKFKFFKEMLEDEDSEIYEAIKKLTEQQKIYLLASLVSGNSERIIGAFKTLKIYSVMVRLDFTENTIKHFAETEYEPDPANPGKLLNSTVLAFISALLNINTSPGIREVERKKLVVNALQSVPESEVPINLKLEMARECGVTDEIHPHCNSTVILQEPESEIVSRITYTQYSKAIQNKKMDYSTFIILTLGLLKSKLKLFNPLGFKGLIDQLHECYFQGEYNECIHLIKLACQKYSEELGASKASILSKLEPIPTLKPVADVYTLNAPRRFFETRLSQYILACDINVDALNNVINHFHGNRLTNKEDIGHTISIFSELSNNEISSKTTEYKENSAAWKLRKRSERRGFFSKSRETEEGILGESIYSRNPGVLTSISPNFYDNLTAESMRNKTVDIDSNSGNTFRNKPYVANVSGHIFHIVALLESYMRNQVDNSQLHEDVNEFMKACVATYVSKGYHSFHEMLTILSEPHIRAVFAQYGVRLDLGVADKVYDYAMSDTLQYTTMMALKVELHKEVKVECSARSRQGYGN